MSIIRAQYIICLLTDVYSLIKKHIFIIIIIIIIAYFLKNILHYSDFIHLGTLKTELFCKSNIMHVV